MSKVARITPSKVRGIVFIIAVALIAGCPGQEPTQPKSPAPLAPPKPAAAQPTKTQPQAGQAGSTSKPTSAKPSAPAPASQASFRLVVTAEFSELPTGAIIVAPSARDRRFQKVTKSDHQGVTGSVVPTDDGNNLFFVSEPVKAATASYTGTFEVTRRLASQGDVTAAKGASYDEGKGKVKAAPTAGEVLAAAKALGASEPHGALVAVMGKVSAMKVTDDGSAAESEVLSGQPASPYGATRAASLLLNASAVPAAVKQGYQSAKVPHVVTKPHAWLQVEMPRLGWVPVDVVMRRAHAAKLEGDDPLYFGLVPPDRAEMVVGDSVSIPETKGINPELKLEGVLAAPFAVKDGARVGKVSWKASFEALK